MRVSHVMWLPILACLAVSCTPETGSEAPRSKEPSQSWPREVVSVGDEMALVDGTLVFFEAKEFRGVDAASGRELWTLPARTTPPLTHLSWNRFTVAGKVIILAEAQYLDEVAFLRAIDPRTGRVLWSDGPVASLEVTRDAAFVHTCPTETGPCTIARREPRTGRTVWSARSGQTPFRKDPVFGSRRPLAPPTGRYIVSEGTRSTGLARDARSGRPAAAIGIGSFSTWFSVGRTVISARGVDTGGGPSPCAMRLTSFDAKNSRRNWKRDLYFPLATERDCNPGLPNAAADFVGAGTRIAAVTAGGGPQVLDLATGKILWKRAEAGIPVDAAASSLLVRLSAAHGPLTMLELATGRPRWTAPDPGLASDDGRWRTSVGRRFTTVAELRGGKPSVAVYSTATGRLLGRYTGFFKGSGENWIAVTRTGGTRQFLDFIRL